MIQLGRHAVYDEYHQIPRKEYDLVITDPPWNATGIKFDKEGFEHDHLAEWLSWNMKQNAWCFAFLPFEVAGVFANRFRRKFTYIWKKPSGIYREAVKRPIITHEEIYAFIRPDLQKMGDLYMDKKALRTKGTPYMSRNTDRRDGGEYSKGMGYAQLKRTPIQNDGYREGVSILEYKNLARGNCEEYTEHPTQKPVDLVRLLIRSYCPPGATVLDPTAGSGTTLMACEIEGRTCVCAENDPKYRAMIETRFNKTLGGWQHEA